MRFIDEANIYVKAGDGGNGIVAWRREAHVPMGGPAGGDGGNGGNVIFVADNSMHSLLDFKYQKRLLAKNGSPGRNKNMHGQNGNDKIVPLPVGTQIFDEENGQLLADMIKHGQEEIICKGGSGGFGNTRFLSSTRQAPDFANDGLPGEEKKLKLSLKLMADVGLVGFPNAGKSTLLSSISAAKPKIANYPFTTLVPNLGVVKAFDHKTFVMADVPGLIEGASSGVGLGIRFLKHLERVNIICHLVEPEPSSSSNENALTERYLTIRRELKNFSEELANQKEIVAITKDDIGNASLPKAKENFKVFLNEKNIPFLEISSINRKGLPELINLLYRASFTNAQKP